jgi:hypothetical protein
MEQLVERNPFVHRVEERFVPLVALPPFLLGCLPGGDVYDEALDVQYLSVLSADPPAIE